MGFVCRGCVTAEWHVIHVYFKSEAFGLFSYNIQYFQVNSDVGHDFSFYSYFLSCRREIVQRNYFVISGIVTPLILIKVT